MNVAVFIWALKRGKCSGRGVVAAAALWLIGSAPYSLLVLGALLHSGDFAGTLRSALVGEYSEHVFNARLGTRMLLLSAAFIAYNFPGLTVPLAVYGVIRGWSGKIIPPVFWRVLVAELAIFTLFVVRYSIIDQYTFFFPVYLVLTLLAAVGVAEVLKWGTARARRVVVTVAALSACWTPVAYVASAELCRSRGLFKSLVGNKPYRDAYRFFFVPWGVGSDETVQLNRAVRELATDRGLVLATDPVTEVGIRVARTVGRLPESLEIVRVARFGPDEREAQWRALILQARADGRPVVLVPRDRDHPETCIEGARWERVSDLYRLVDISTAAASQPAENGGGSP